MKKGDPREFANVAMRRELSRGTALMPALQKAQITQLADYLRNADPSQFESVISEYMENWETTSGIMFTYEGKEYPCPMPLEETPYSSRKQYIRNENPKAVVTPISLIRDQYRPWLETGLFYMPFFLESDHSLYNSGQTYLKRHGSTWKHEFGDQIVLSSDVADPQRAAERNIKLLRRAALLHEAYKRIKAANHEELAQAS